MAKGVKTGGRHAGTPNNPKLHLELENLYNQVHSILGEDPVVKMAKVCMHQSCSLELQEKLLKNLTRLFYAEKKSVEVSGPGGELLEIRLKRL